MVKQGADLFKFVKLGVAGKEMSDKTLISPGPICGSVTEAKVQGEQQYLTALNEKRALTEKLMERVCDRDNLNQAYERVISNKGSAGVDGLSTQDLFGWLKQNKESFIESLLNGTYKPKAVRGVKIPKPAGGMRQLGIPTVIDRLVQQAIHQVLDPIFDPDFSGSSYGFRKGRGAHDAVEQASNYVKEGYNIVVDLDLEKFFDRVNHDILMSRLSRRISDKRLLKIIGRFLRAGIMEDGVCQSREEGTPQGSPLSPLLSNFLLDDLDKELGKRGHKFCRYADDCNIYVRSIASGERVLASITKFLDKRLRLKVNQEKSGVDSPSNRKFLGYSIESDGRISIAKPSIKHFRDRVRKITKRNRGKSLKMIIAELNPLLRGWSSYFYLCHYYTSMKDLDGWVRRRLRCYRLKQCRRRWTVYKYLQSEGLPKHRAWATASLNFGWWKASATPGAHEAMPLNWFKEKKLVSMFGQQKKLRLNRNRRDTLSVCPVV